MVNLTLTYILWGFGGLLGLHHLYLGRPRQAFIWLVTWGGMGIGWLSEVTRIKDYVDEANNNRKFREYMRVVKTHSPRPGFSPVLLGSQLMIGHQLGKLLINAPPEYYTVEAWYGPILSHLLAALGASIGVYLASNIGPQKAPFFIPFLASAATVPTQYLLLNRRNIYIIVCVIVASFITLPEALSNFLRTQPWDDARTAAEDMIPCLRLYGLDACQNRLLSTLAEISDPGRDAWAFMVLGFDKYPSQKQINSHCRKMASKWHPDRFAKKNETVQKEAEQKFLDIQKACGMLNKAKQQRERINTWTSSEPADGTVYTGSDDVDTQTSDEDGNNHGDNEEFDDDGDDYHGDYADNDDDDTHNDENDEEEEETDNLEEQSYCDKENDSC
ncbi:dnaJ homolog subfamily C member 22-like [Mya arenaria]|uniref:dnaJ homolog subfamily C member 22-like n=1 Tax=Mya arenaria TaxID=6604 RepID=UPI0022E91777|nr:dnaJ homolog subfamily C member 22-like [Mya arenaria]